MIIVLPFLVDFWKSKHVGLKIQRNSLALRYMCLIQLLKDTYI